MYYIRVYINGEFIAKYSVSSDVYSNAMLSYFLVCKLVNNSVHCGYFDISLYCQGNCLCRFSFDYNKLK